MFQMPIFFYLTCDVIDDPQANAIKFRSTTLAGLTNAVWILKIDPVVSDIGRGLIFAPPSGARVKWYNHQTFLIHCLGIHLKLCQVSRSFRSSSGFGDILQNVKGATLCPPAARGLSTIFFLRKCLISRAMVSFQTKEDCQAINRLESVTKQLSKITG